MKTPAGAAWVNQSPNLMQQGATMGEQIGPIAFQNAMTKAGRDLESEGIIVTKDPSMMDQLLNMLR